MFEPREKKVNGCHGCYSSSIRARAEAMDREQLPGGCAECYTTAELADMDGFGVSSETDTLNSISGKFEIGELGWTDGGFLYRHWFWTPRPLRRVRVVGEGNRAEMYFRYECERL